MPSGTELKQLAQSFPAVNTATSIFSPDNFAIIKQIYITNNANAASNYSIFHDNDGTTYSNSTVLYSNCALAAYTTLALDTNIIMNNTSGNLAVQAHTANTITFTLYGEAR